MVADFEQALAGITHYDQKVDIVRLDRWIAKFNSSSFNGFGGIEGKKLAAKVKAGIAKLGTGNHL